MNIAIKFCGLITSADVAAAAAAGGRYAGFVFYPKSPRAVTVEWAKQIAQEAPQGLVRVGLTVDMDDGALAEIAASGAIDTLQLHGHETPERVAEIKSKFGLPVIKAISIADRSDLEKLTAFSQVADQLLLDAKPPKDGLPGGNGLAFDWRLLQGLSIGTPWLLAGGLTTDNVAQAVQITGASQVDVSSGVESAPGKKDPAAMQAFAAALTAEAAE